MLSYTSDTENFVNATCYKAWGLKYYASMLERYIKYLCIGIGLKYSIMFPYRRDTEIRVCNMMVSCTK